MHSRCRATVFYACSARLCHRCHRSAAWTAPDALSRAVGVGPGAVTADDFRAGMSLQPVPDSARLPVGQQVDKPPGLDVDQSRALDAAPAEREVIHAQHPHRARLRDGSAISSRSMQIPGSAAATAPSSALSCGVRRAYRVVRPSTCSANVRFAQTRASQKKAGRSAGSSPAACRSQHLPAAARSGCGPGRTSSRTSGTQPRPRPGPDAHEPGGHRDPIDDHPG
jgi:hypothetical protein